MTEERARPTPPEAGFGPPETREVTVEVELDAAPRSVWRALTEPDLLAAWLAPAEAGAEVRAVEIDPGRGAIYEWREAGQGGTARRSTVTFTLEAAEGGGARLRIVHAAPVVVTASRRPPALRLRGAPALPARLRPTSLRWAA